MHTTHNGLKYTLNRILQDTTGKQFIYISKEQKSSVSHNLSAQHPHTFTLTQVHYTCKNKPPPPIVNSLTMKLTHHAQTIPNTVGSRLSEPRLSVSGHSDVSSRHHFFGPSGKNMLRSLDFWNGKKKCCCTNDFPERYNTFSIQYGIQFTIYVRAHSTKPRTL